jgi:hypothetical protein
VRITLADKIDSDIACQLANQLELPFISLTNSPGPSRSLPSDDEDIHLICAEIIKNRSPNMTGSRFFLNDYPQNVTQAQSLDMALARIGQTVSTALMLESAKISQNRTKLALIRYYRSQNKLIFIDESSSIEDICTTIHSIYDKRRTQVTAQ